MTAGGSLKCQVMENTKCGFPMERRAGGQNKSLGQASHSCCKDGCSRGEAKIAICVICHLPLGWGRELALYGIHKQIWAHVHT